MYGTTESQQWESASLGQATGETKQHCCYFLLGFLCARFTGFLCATVGFGGAFSKLRSKSSVRLVARGVGYSSSDSSSRRISSGDRVVGLVIGYLIDRATCHV